MRPEVSAASITRSLKVWRLRMASAPRQRASLNSAMRWSVSTSYGRLRSLPAPRGANGDAFFIPEDVRQYEQNAAGVDQVVDPAQALADRERRGKQLRHDVAVRRDPHDIHPVGALQSVLQRGQGLGERLAAQEVGEDPHGSAQPLCFFTVLVG